MLGGYVGKILRVNLSDGTIAEEGLGPEARLRKYLGCYGLGLKILDEELPQNIKPTDPENLLIFMTGPLTGTPVLSGNNTSVITLSHETGYTVGVAHSHGNFGPYLKFAGYDGIIIQGAAKKPVYLYISPRKTELRDASHLWGKDSHDSEDILKNEIGDGSETSVAAIGTGGENLLAGGTICNDRHHMWAKGGVGSIMGSKKLKAIAVSTKGGKGIRIADVKGLLEVTSDWRESALSPAVWISQIAGPKGIHAGWWRYSGKGGPPPEWMRYFMANLQAVKNLSDPEFGPKWGGAIYAEAPKFEITPVACYACPRACAYAIKITTGPYKGVVATLAGGGENLEGAAGMAGVIEPGTVFYLIDLFDRVGLDSSTAGCSIGLAFECYDKGIINKEDTDGLELTWGNADAVIRLLDKMVKRDGFGAILADGPKKAAELIGGDAPKYVVHIKGTGMNLHDWRAAWGKLLGQITAGAGPCHQSLPGDAFSLEPDVGITKFINPVTPDGKAEGVWKSRRKKLVEDCLGVCLFAVMGVPGALGFDTRALAATVGWADFTVNELLTVGDRLSTMQRLFNIKRGLTKESDFDVGQRLLDAPKSGIAAGRAFGDHMVKMVEEYYQLEGWNPVTGEPLPETVERLGLTEVAKG